MRLQRGSSLLCNASVAVLHVIATAGQRSSINTVEVGIIDRPTGRHGTSEDSSLAEISCRPKLDVDVVRHHDFGIKFLSQKLGVVGWFWPLLQVKFFSQLL